MNPWVLLATAQIPGGGDLRLLQRGAEFSINLEGGVLMNSRMRGSEQELARIGCAKIATSGRPRVLIGGLGMGFTLRAALDLLGPEAEVVVAELVPAVVAWNRGPLAGLSGDSLSDPRVTIREADVAGLIRSGRGAYDAILLDVDNGPDGLTRGSNDGLYDAGGLQAAWTALRPGGVLAVWSAAPDRAFGDRLRRLRFRVEEITVRAHGKRGLRHLIWAAERQGGRARNTVDPPLASGVGLSNPGRPSMSDKKAPPPSKTKPDA
jgi:spermidine synthase